MSYKKFTFCILMLVVLLFPCNMALNFLINPYETFSLSPMPKGINSAERFEKIDYLLSYHQNFDSYLIGSSRVGFIEPKLIESYLRDAHFYNAYVSSGNPLDAAIFIDYLIEKHYKIKYLFIQIGLDSAIETVDTHTVSANNILYTWHYDVTHKSIIDFYKPYFTSFLFKGSYEKIKSFLREDPPVYKDIHTGVWGYTARERERLANKDEYVKNEPSFHKSRPITIIDKMDKKHFTLLTQSLRDINARCTQGEFECIIVTAPVSHIRNQCYSQELLDSILTLMANTFEKGFWHFGYLNSITTNNFNYYEDAHQVPEVDAMILAKVFNKPSNAPSPNDFGIYITKQNLKESLQTIHAIEAPYRAVK